ncbi:MAG: hypothetical protein PHG51_04700 [Candidatus Omnitrophica bacterium]|jgi:hypothetical protein|nr:hypothetical protein [Candidatus Omnitrophota bacterium]
MVDNLLLAKEYFEQVMERPIENIPPVKLMGWDVVNIIWPLNDIFRPKWYQINSVRYRVNFEKRADQAIESFVKAPISETWEDLHPGTWRVLLERHTQLIQFAMANEIVGDHITSLPLGFPENYRLPAVMLLLLHSMKLPWKPEDRSQLEAPGSTLPESMRLH